MAESYQRLVTRAAWTASFVSGFLLILKFIAWWLTNSISLLAFLTDGFADLIASLLNLWVLKYALQPPDADHPFGHGKAESLAALVQSILLFSLAVFLFISALHRILLPRPTIESMVALTITVISFFVTLGLVRFQRRIIRATGSLVIRADMLHYQSDLLLNGGVLLALVLQFFKLPFSDGFFGTIISLYIVYTAVQVAKEAIRMLLDTALPETDQQTILAIAKGQSNVLGIHDVRMRQAGKTRFVQLHIELLDNLPLLEAHRIGDTIELAIRDRFPDADVVIHLDPQSLVLPHLRGKFDIFTTENMAS